jgi:CxxC motif-containing protein (DUF1111 family)
LRARPRLMHDGQSLTLAEAIERHRGQASGVIQAYRNLSSTAKRNLLIFLNSL